MRAAVLRIFSGLHIGAEIELTEGVYVIGTDDSCDLILSDSSLKARHAALRVSVSGDSVRFSAEPLDGPVFCSSSSFDDESDIAPLFPFQLGLLTAAWLPDDAPDRAAGWAAVEDQLKEKDEPKTPAVQPAEEGVRAEPSDDVPDDAASSPAPLLEETEKPKSTRCRDLCLIASMVLVGGAR